MVSKLNPQFDGTPFSPESFKSHLDVLRSKKQGKENKKNSVLAFPVEVFPESIQKIINATNISLKFPIDFTGVSILFASSVAIGNACMVEVKKDWIESAVLYIAIIGRAGTNKSHPLSFFIEPLIKKDNHSFSKYEKQRDEYEKAICLTRKERLKEGIEDPVKPELKKLIVSDITPEALASVHKSNKRGIGVYADELAGWFKNFDRYHKGSEQEFWLTNWSGKPIIIDRKTGEPIRITNPFIPVCGTIQPLVLDEMAKDNRAQNGFIDRILMVMPEGLKKESWGDEELDFSYSEGWKNVLENLLNVPFELDSEGIPKPHILRFRSEAKALLKEWQIENANKCNCAENEVIAGIYAKLEAYCIRLSLILQMLYYSCGLGDKDEITKEAVRGAIKLTEYFRTMAYKVYSIISNASPLDKLPRNKIEFYDSLPEIVQTGEAIELAKKFSLSSRTVKRLLNENSLFRRLNRGEYEKLL